MALNKILLLAYLLIHGRFL